MWRRGILKHSWGIGRAPDAPSWITIPWSHLTFDHAYEAIAAHHFFPTLHFLCPTSTSCTWCGRRIYCHESKENDYWMLFHQSLNLLNMSICPPPPLFSTTCALETKVPSAWGSSSSEGTSTTWACGNTKDKKHKIVEVVAVEASILHETTTTQMSLRCVLYFFLYLNAWLYWYVWGPGGLLMLGSSQ